MKIDALIDFFQELSPERVADFPAYYSSNAWFKDPFNEVQGLAAIQDIFSHMYSQVDAPRFVITEKIESGQTAVLVWQFHFRVRRWGKGEPQVMHGVSHLRFDSTGKVCYHRDYWDTGEELYMKVPGLSILMRGLRRLFAA